MSTFVSRLWNWRFQALSAWLLFAPIAVQAQTAGVNALTVFYPQDPNFNGSYLRDAKPINDNPVYIYDTKKEGKFRYLYVYLHNKNQQLWVLQPVPPDLTQLLADAQGIGPTPWAAKWDKPGFKVTPVGQTAGNPAPVANFRKLLNTHEWLHQNESIESEDRRFKVLLKGDGELVVLEGAKVVWSNGTKGRATKGFCQMLMQPDGNLVLYHYVDAAYQSRLGPIWETGAKPAVAAMPKVQNNFYAMVLATGEFAVYAGKVGQAFEIWKSPAAPNPAATTVFSRASQAALATVNSVKSSSSDAPGFYSLPSNYNDATKKLGLGANAKISFYRKFGPRELSFLVASDNDNVVVAIRGTEGETNWRLNGVPFYESKAPDGSNVAKIDWGIVQLDCLFNGMPVVRPAYPGLIVHNGWQLGVDSIWPTVLKELREHQAERKTIAVAGHSLGGALSGYLTYRLLRETNYFDPQKEHLLATFGAPHYALRTEYGAPATVFGELYLNSYATFNGAYRGVVSAFNKALNGNIPGAVSDAQRAIVGISNFKLPQSPNFKADFKSSLGQLVNQKAPRMKLYTVEARGPNGVDVVTICWDLRGIADFATKSLKEPLEELRKPRVITGIPLIGSIRITPPGLEGIVNPLIQQINQLGQIGFGTAERVGTLIEVRTTATGLFDVHDFKDSYLKGLIDQKLVSLP